MYWAAAEYGNIVVRSRESKSITCLYVWGSLINPVDGISGLSPLVMKQDLPSEVLIGNGSLFCLVFFFFNFKIEFLLKKYENMF